MANAVFTFEEFNFGGIQDKFSSYDKGFESVQGGKMGKQMQFYGAEEWGESEGIDSLHSDIGYYQDNSSDIECIFTKYQQLEQQQQSFPDYGHFDDTRYDIVSPPLQACLEEITKLGEVPTMIPDAEPKKERRYPFSLASLELLKNYGSGFKRLNGERIIEPSNDATTCMKMAGQELSTEEIMRVAGARFIQSSTQTVDAVSLLSHPYDFSFSGLSDEEIKNVELAELLLAAAEKVGYQQFDRATKLLNQCDCLSSDIGNPVQRVVCYFSEALRERIDRETGRITLKGLGKKQSFDVDEAMMSPNLANLACHQGIPFCQATQFTGIQAIIENVADARKVHVIDLAIRNGVQWTVLMQALAARYECPIELLKITAVGTTLEHTIEETGKRLVSFAQSMNLPFSFKVLMVPDMLDLKEDLFELDAEEAVAVYSQLLLRTMLPQPDRLESVMKVIRNITPRILVVTEVEANHNSPTFVNRFIDVLFYFSAYFDCLETCMKRDDPNRMITESLYFSQGIRNMVAAEGEERKTRHVKIDVWRAFFSRYGLVETELSTAALYQASLVVKKFACGGSCTLDMNGNTLTVGWKGTPIQSLSVWKFV